MKIHHNPDLRTRNKISDCIKQCIKAVLQLISLAWR